MKFTVNTHEFLKAITAVDGVITVREIKSALSNLKIQATDNAVYLSATDLEIAIKTSVSAVVGQKGSASLPAKQLSNIFKNLNFDSTSLATNDNQESSETLITDATGKMDTKFKVNGIDSDDIKTIPSVSESSVVEFPCQTIREMFRKTSYAMAIEETRFVFNGLFLKPNDTDLIVVGTDGRRLSKVVRKFPKQFPFKNGVIIPHKAVREMLKMMEGKDTAKIGFIDEQIYVSSGNVELLFKLIDGNFPDYEQVIPKQTSQSVRFQKADFLTFLKQALISAEEPSKQIRLSFSSGNVNISSSNPGTMMFDHNMPTEYSGDSITIAFKGDYLSDVVKAIDDPEVILEFTSSSAPVLFKDPSDSDFVSVIMPMKL
ncbi:DNA-directed DNA polymerase subunit beta [Leptospira ryugenii]|uniref:Beta sliding clamp n=1 Tax=Leptospira ryugenii TaxID=1917863 RepID=A0A2P2E354_9LEPT|nr:DNA polymerase III subunit beta [Leptospira ryugenii]GBF51333.1 DNA-directed DNA polymerase subunit beta [Leptospira ryugenii]